MTEKYTAGMKSWIKQAGTNLNGDVSPSVNIR